MCAWSGGGEAMRNSYLEHCIVQVLDTVCHPYTQCTHRYTEALLDGLPEAVNLYYTETINKNSV